MKIADVRKLIPYERLSYFIRERESIRLKRVNGDPPPWTDDSVLQQYKFTNVRRMDDRVSVWLYKNWYKPYYDHPNSVLAAVLARHFNHTEFLGRIGYPEKWNPKAIKDTATEFRAAGKTVFSGAYVIRADGKFPDKATMVVDETCQAFIDDPPVIVQSSMQVTHETIQSYRNLGSFMAGQCVADLRWAMSGSWADRNDWAPMGPGSKRGLNVTLGREPDAPLTQAAFLRDLLGLRDKLVRDLSPGITSRLELMDLQNCCCEQWKYARTILGIGKPKQLYPGRG